MKNLITLFLIVLFSQNSFSKDKKTEYMGHGMMGQGRSMMGMCSGTEMKNITMTTADTTDGVTITYSAKDKKDVVRLQKMAQMHKLAQELKEDEPQTK